MPAIEKSALVPYDAKAMFHLVDDIESYPKFLPWCGSAHEISRSTDEVQASIEIAHKGVHKTFTTQNRMQAGKMIEMRLVNGPFKYLHGFWQFQQLGEKACKVSLSLDYEFSNKLLSLAVGPVFNQIANTLVDAFCNRADNLYGLDKLDR